MPKAATYLTINLSINYSCQNFVPSRLTTATSHNVHAPAGLFMFTNKTAQQHCAVEKVSTPSRSSCSHGKELEFPGRFTLSVVTI